MEKFINVVSNIDSWFKFVSFVFFIIAFIVYMKWDSLVKFFSRKKQKERLVSDLINHSVFYRIDQVLSKVNRMEFITHGQVDYTKTKLMRLLIHIQLTMVKESVKRMLIDESNQKISENDLENKIMTLNESIVESYNSKAKGIFIREYNILEDDADLLINAYTDFREDYHDDYNSQMISIAKDNTYTDNYQKIKTLLEVVSTSLYPIPVYAKVAMDEVNGTFMKYNKKN